MMECLLSGGLFSLRACTIDRVRCVWRFFFKKKGLMTHTHTHLSKHTQRLSPQSPLLVLDDDDAFTASSARALSLHAVEPSVLLEVGGWVGKQ